MSELTILVVSFNSFNVIRKCLHDVIGLGQYRIIIIDNASTDGSACMLANNYPHAEILAMEQNLGYGRAANVGLKKVRTPYALLLNPDLVVTTSEIDKLLAEAEQSPPKAAIWGPATSIDEVAKRAPRSVEWISGCAMLFEMNKLMEIGLFDENFFMFFEETDLCCRARANGYQVLKCNNVYFQHLVGQASPPDPALEYMKNWHYGWSRGFYMKKHEEVNRESLLRKRLWTYRLKSWTSTNRKKRSRYRAAADGLEAFTQGTRAFTEDGNPNGMPLNHS
jgi:N-acetylglucosaminyl-diphospho-decaprenol L-rhamnosyltransferase